MSRAGWERQALNSIQSVLGHTDPKLASHLAGFSRLASSEEMPAHERVRSPLRQIIEHCRPHLAAYKRPRSVRFVPDLPKTSTGKVMRRQLKTLDR